MKKIIFFLLALASSQFLFAQAPQGINYQAVAMNASGAITNKNISLRLSIVDSIATGNVLYTETHNTTTDAIGSFSVVIGNGTITLGNFSTINWGKNYKWLKTEIDTLGGSSFVVMGITQFMSTPYALYSNSSKSNYVDITHPDGYSNATLVVITNSNYTVPAGKNLYCPPSVQTIYNGDTLYNGTYSPNSTIHCFSGDTIITWLFDKRVDWKVFDLVTTPLVVPTGREFVITYIAPSPYLQMQFLYPWVFLNGSSLGSNYFRYGNITNGQNVLVIPSGATLSAQLQSGTSGRLTVNGYFIDN
jgi:hypothetical protein